MRNVDLLWLARLQGGDVAMQYFPGSFGQGVDHPDFYLSGAGHFQDQAFQPAGGRPFGQVEQVEIAVETKGGPGREGENPRRFGKPDSAGVVII